MAALSSDRPVRRPARPDGSMSLLVDITHESLDAAYAEHAERKASGATAGDVERPRRTPRRRAVGAVLLLLLGVLTGTAVDQVRDRAAAATGVRASLAAEVRATTAESDALVAQADALRTDVAATRELALGADARGRAAAERVAQVALAAAAVPVVGPGIVVTVDDAAVSDLQADPRGGTTEARRISDRDLQGVVNGVWAAGAEAVSVNGIRLSALTAIRSAGEAILVDFRPLSPPYVVEAIGDADRLEVDFVDGPVGRRFTTLALNDGFGFDVRRDDELRLASAGEPDLRAAVPLPAGAPR